MFRIKVSINYVENKQKKSKVNNPKADSFWKEQWISWNSYNIKNREWQSKRKKMGVRNKTNIYREEIKIRIHCLQIYENKCVSTGEMNGSLVNLFIDKDKYKTWRPMQERDI